VGMAGMALILAGVVLDGARRDLHRRVQDHTKETSDAVR
jgi:hypothetical protein